MKRILLLTVSLAGLANFGWAQTNPAITSWLINTTHQKAKHYVAGNSTPIQDTAQVNVQKVRYTNSNVYLNASGLPSYLIGPYQDGNPSQATNRNFVFRIPLSPAQNTGTLTNVGTGQTGVFINGVPMYNYTDARSYKNAGIWHQNAVYFENKGFDCAKGHPSPVFQGPPGMGGTLVGGTYHHHQNPSAFNLGRATTSTVCNLYLSDGLYVPDSTKHSPLIGFAFDGYPVYGAYGYANSNGTGGIKRLTPSYRLRNISNRHSLTSGALPASQYGPAISADTALGAYNEDYEFVSGSGDLDVHNGRFSVTPEYPNGIYCYFATIDADWKSVYPYIMGPTYYGVVATDNFPVMGGTNPTSVTVPSSGVTVYNPPVTAVKVEIGHNNLNLYPNPVSDFLAVQISGLLKEAATIELYSLNGKLIQTTTINPGSSMGYFDTRTLYNGIYVVKANLNGLISTHKVEVNHGF